MCIRDRPSNQHWEMQKVLRDEYTGSEPRTKRGFRGEGFVHTHLSREQFPPLASPHTTAQPTRKHPRAGMVHISTGMTTKDEVEKIVSFWEQGEGDAKNRVVLYNCTSGYPVPFEDVCLLELKLLRRRFGHRVKSLGFSGHHLGISVDIAAYALGATWNERHFTKDRTWKGTDHAASLEAAGLAKLCRDLKAAWKCMRYKESDILPLEAAQRAKLKWGCYNQEQAKKTAL